MSVRRPGGLAEEARTRSVLGAFFEVYNTLGFGFVETVYRAALVRELQRRGHDVAREVGIWVRYKGEVIARQRVDLFVDNAVIVEVKCTQRLADTASPQLYNYLKATDIEVGLLLHFGPEPKFYRLFLSNHRKLPPSRLAAQHERK